MFFFNTLISFLSDRQYRKLLALTFVVLIIGTFIYHKLEGWSYLDAFYFSIITLTTVGYGDFSPQTTEGKLFTILYIIIGISIILTFIDTVYHHFEKSERVRRRRRFTKKFRREQYIDDDDHEDDVD